MRVLIADDEAPARDRLRQLLAAHPEFQVVAEAENGTEAVQLSASLSPDLVFLDVQMPGATGLDVAACLPAPRPAVIFCTAFEQHAVDAFELNAVDYLLKPVSRARLAESLRRVLSPASAVSEVESDRPLTGKRSYPTRFLVRSGSHYVIVSAQRTAYWESIDGLTRLTTGDGQVYWTDPSLQDLELQLDPARYFRISRNVIVALAEISELHPLPGGSAQIVLKRGERFEVSRRRVRALIGILERS